MTLHDAQDWIAQRAPRPYYAERYRAMEADYLPTLCKLVDAVHPARALDIGPGWGTMARYLSASQWTVTVLDFVRSGSYLTPETAAEMGVETIEADICRTAPPAGAFDLVLMTQVIPHLKWNPARALANAAGALATGGLLIAAVLDVAAYAPRDVAYTHWTEVPDPEDGVPPSPNTITTMYSKDDFRLLLAGAFHNVTVFRRQPSTCLFALCRNPISDPE